MPGDMDLTASAWGYACLAIFALAYALVVLEERLHLRKSIPALVAASGGLDPGRRCCSRCRAKLTWPRTAFRHNLLDYAELMLFLLAAMTFVNTLGGTRRLRRPSRAAGRARVQPPRDLLDHGGAGVRHLADRRQPDDGPHHGRRGAGGRSRSAEVRGGRLHQRGRGGQRRRGIQPVRRHHHAHGVAARRRALRALLRAVRSVAGELAGSGGDHVVLDRQGADRSGVRGRRHEEGRPGGRGLAPRHDRAHGRHPQRARPAAGVRNDDRASASSRCTAISSVAGWNTAIRRTAAVASTSSTTWRPVSRVATGDHPPPRSRQRLRRVPAARAGRVGHADVLLRRHPGRRRSRRARATSRSPPSAVYGGLGPTWANVLVGRAHRRWSTTSRSCSRC